MEVSKGKKLKRKEVLEKKKAIDSLIKAASIEKDHLASFPPFRNFNRNVSEKDVNFSSWTGDGDPVVGFVHYRFVVEEDVPVCYVYELQLERHVQGKGLGKFLMQLIELIACKSRMGAVMLTVQKVNILAMDFYMNKLRYVISTISPSKVEPLFSVEKSYEILCKTFDHASKVKLTEGKLENDGSVF
ncbi:hypothetical protein IFM89_020809 [Coptis chinensis]|uniref:N-alpha-acetyltransferase 40 n=1 Tax=Coptis chinensis TaxID=261450 RepID=A0A835MA65_9MAGN|nr:hypothetical protein IFM89_020809 [Coptis chinensis]